MFGRSTGSFDRLVEKATSQLLLEPDWDTIMQICDCIRQGDVPPKHALAAVKKKLQHDNPHVALYALQVLESSVKNCGGLIQAEIATKEFMEFFKELIKSKPEPVKNKVLELVQCWSHAFRGEPTYQIVGDTFQILKVEGYTFPQLREADAMFKAEVAPEWKDGEVCHRCRVQFTVVVRRHHCRACGQIFCGKCSSKSSIIPKFGIEKEVRVCDSCFEVLNKQTGAAAGKKSEDDLPAEYLASPLSQQPQTTPQRSEQEIQEEEELQLAIALSRSEAESKEKERNRLRSNYTLHTNTTTASNAGPSYSQPPVSAPVFDTTEMDPELAHYLNRNYWEQKHDTGIKVSTTQPSAPPGSLTPTMVESKISDGVKVEEVHVTNVKYQNGETDDQEQFLNALRGSIEILVNRMKSNSQRGRSIANDSSVQTLFMTINAMHPQLMKYVSDLEDSRAKYETMQDELAQIRDAREALEALREEQAEKRRREHEELERQRQIAMAQKLEIMRQKKVEYLEQQRLMALQRMQEQEREMMMRLEQQKHMQQIRAQQPVYQQMYGQPGVGQPPPGQHFSPAGSTEGSPLHHPHPGAMYSGNPYPQQMPPHSMPPEYSEYSHGVPPHGMPAMGGPPGSVPPPTSQHPMYNPPGGFQGPPPAASQAPSGAGPPGAYQSQQFQNVPPGSFPPPVTTQGPAPTQGGPHQPPQGYNPAGPPGMEYGAYSMQSMANTLPSQQGPPVQAGAPGQPNAGGPYVGPPGNPQYAPPPPGGVAGPPPNQGGMVPGQNQSGGQQEQLICFD